MPIENLSPGPTKYEVSWAKSGGNRLGTRWYWHGNMLHITVADLQTVYLNG